MEKYKVLEAIGQGSFGRVFRGKCLLRGQVVALKFIPKRNKVERELKSLRRECEIQRGLAHPNIVRMIDSFETENEVVAVMSQQQVKEQQCKELVERAAGQSKVAGANVRKVSPQGLESPTLPVDKALGDVPVPPAPVSFPHQNERKKSIGIPQIDGEMLKKLQAVHLQTGSCQEDLGSRSPSPYQQRYRGREKMIQVHLSSSTDVSIQSQKQCVHTVEADVHINACSKESVSVAGRQDYEPDVRSAIGASIRKLSRVSQEPGFKEEDVKDFQTYGPVPLEDRKDNMLAILNHILRKTSENQTVVEKILGTDASVLLLLGTLITHRVPVVRARLCTLIGYLAKCCPQVAKLFEGQHKLICDLINLESDLVPQVRKAASFAVSCLQSFTELIPDDSCS
ncbi:Serine/threonine-protein kinase 36 [Portunus trituberculatus]|uniref:non-specific serine/threonine protein kinase n=1 Tax=Portunus trituberculatus TaxID=210409 RepID=A0A5B7FCX6_PORTR|nr:Serine/threonine-protein kinase 36 [Portunus trituberculatus]